LNSQFQLFTNLSLEESTLLLDFKEGSVSLLSCSNWTKSVCVPSWCLKGGCFWIPAGSDFLELCNKTFEVIFVLSPGSLSHQLIKLGV